MRTRLFGSLVLVSSVSAVVLAIGCGNSDASGESGVDGGAAADSSSIVPTGSTDASNANANGNETGTGNDGAASPGQDGGGKKAVTPPVSSCAPAKVTLGTPADIELADQTVSTANVTTGDFDNDGAADIAVLVSGGIDVFFSKKDGTFSAPIAILDHVGSGPAFAAADFSGDGIPDLVVSSFGKDTVDQSVDLIVSNGDGTFQPPASYADQSTLLFSLHAADVNKDGKLDLVYDGQDSSGVLLNDGQGFASPGSPITIPATRAIYDVADFDGDGAADIVYADVNDGACIMLNDGSGTFGKSTCFAGAPASAPDLAYAGDVNGDGKMDAVTFYDGRSGQNGSPNIGVYLGKGDGTLGTVANVTTGGVVIAAAIVDANNDRKADLVLFDGTSVRVVLNDGTGAFTATPSVHPLGTGSLVSPVVAGDFRANGLRGFVGLEGTTEGIAVLSASCSD